MKHLLKHSPVSGKSLSSRIWITPLALLLLGCFPPSLSNAADQRNLSDDFESGLEKGAPWAAQQLQRGKARLMKDPTGDSDNMVLALEAGRKKGGKVGKADLIHRFEPLKMGKTINMKARFYIPKGTPLNSLILMDVECASCGLPKNPGVRLYLRDGRIRVDRSKIGIKEPFLPLKEKKVMQNKWFTVHWLLKLGDETGGISKVHLDDELVLDNQGTNLITQKIVDTLADIKIKEQVDRFQIGITANSNKSKAKMLVDDVQMWVE